MTRTLILMRHAKSSWDIAGQADHDRRLNKRGRKSASVLGDWLRAKGHVPDHSLVSTSARTVETYDRLRLDAKPEYVAALYHAEPDTMFQVLQATQGQTVLMLGHNPGIAGFATDIAETPARHSRFVDYPTGATLVVRFDIDDWGDLVWKSGSVEDFVIPRELVE